MRYRRILLSVITLLIVVQYNTLADTTPATAPTTAPLLKVGDPAPAMAKEKFLKGEPVTAIEPGKIYVLEFWATWCVPCRIYMPKISDLSAKNPDIIFIGQNVWDKDDKLVEPYVTKIGDLMKYRVAMDDKTTNPVGVMATTWINATGRTSIPTSIVVKDQKIAFIGQPAELDEVLPLIVAGTYDDAKYQAAQAEKAKADREKAILENLKAERKFEADHPGFAEAREKYDAAIKAKDLDAAISARKEITTIDAKRGDDLLFGEFYLAIQNDRNDIVLADAKPLIAENEKNYPMLNTVAGGIVRMKNPSKENVELALAASNKAVQMTQSKASAVMDVNARLLALHGDWDKAIEEGNKVIELNTVESFKPIYAEHLESYKNKQITHRELR